MAERVQSYLDSHKIGALFEKLMASVIKDMPNEPIQYLMRVLQKMDEKLRSPRGNLDKKMSGSTPLLHKYGLGLSGHPAPTRSLEDPHVLLPGGKSVAASWGSGDFSGPKPPARPSFADPKRSYSKPWLSGAGSGSKPSAVSSKSKEAKGKVMKNSEKPSHSNKEKLSRSADEQPLSPKNTNKVKTPVRYEGVKTWSSGAENDPSGSVISQQSITTYYHSKPGKESEDIGIEISSKDQVEMMDVSSENSSAVSLTKSSKKARHKSKEQKRRLETLLKETKSKQASTTVEKDSEDEAIEVMESTDDLEGEGVIHPTSCGVKLSKSNKPLDSGSNVQIKICARCAKVMSAGQFGGFGGFSETASDIRPTAPRSAFSEISASDDDFESVSQVGAENLRRQIKWPVISDSEGEEKEQQYPAKTSFVGESSPKQKHMYKGISQRSMLSDNKGDFFEANAPGTRPYQAASPPKPGYVSDIESNVISEQNFPVGSHHLALSGGKAWSFKAPDTGSEADTDNFRYGR